MRLREISFQPRKPVAIPPDEEEFWISLSGHSRAIEIGLYFGLKRLGIITSDVAKLVAEAVPACDCPSPSVKFHALNVLTILVPFDFVNYRETVHKSNRAEMIADALECAIRFFSEYRSVSMDTFLDVLRKLHENQYRYELEGKKLFRSPDGKHSIRLLFRWELDEMVLESVVLGPRKQIVGRRVLGTFRNCGVDTIEFFNHSHWIDDQSFLVAPVGRWFPGTVLNMCEVVSA